MLTEKFKSAIICEMLQIQAKRYVLNVIDKMHQELMRLKEYHHEILDRVKNGHKTGMRHTKFNTSNMY